MSHEALFSASASPLVGRYAELERLDELVDAARVVTVTGLPGIGKSRLVSELYRRRWGNSATAAWIDLSSIRDRVTADRLDELLDGHDERDVEVVVVDNCESELTEVGGWLDGLLRRSPRTSAIVTSWRPLEVTGERVLTLGPLAGSTNGLTDDVALLLDAAEEVGVTLSPGPDVTALCQRLGGIPLAIEFAAHRLTLLSPAELAASLDRRLAMLSTRAPSARHRSLEAALDLAVDALDQEERRLLARVSVLVGAFTADTAAALEPQRSATSTLEALHRLVEAGLVVTVPGAVRTSYRLLDPVRTYVLAALGGDAERDEAMRSIAAYGSRLFGELVARDSATPRVTAPLDQLAGLAESYPEVIEHFLARDEPAPAFELFVQFQVVLPAQARAAATLGARLLATWPEFDQGLRSAALATQASALASIGRTREARRYAATAIEAGRDHPVAVVFASWAAGRAAVLDLDWDAALRSLTAAVATAERAGARTLLSESIGRLMPVQCRTGRVDEARRRAGEVIAYGSSIDDAVPHVGGRLALATVARAVGDLDDARRHVTDASDLLDRADTTTRGIGVVEWLRFECDVFRQVLDAESHGFESTLREWAAMLAALTAYELPELTSLALNALGRCAARTGWWALAEACAAARRIDHRAFVYSDPFPTDAPDTRPPGRRAVSTAAVIELLRSTAPVADPPNVTGTAAGATLTRTEQGWTFGFGNRTAVIRPLKGVDDLAQLLSRPGREFAAVDLMGARSAQSSLGDVLDARARRALRRRLAELDQTIELRSHRNDPERTRELLSERAWIVAELRRASGLTGPRQSGATTERARNAVAFRIRAAIAELEQVHPELGRHLRNSVRTGHYCRYEPADPVDWSVEP